MTTSGKLESGAAMNASEVNTTAEWDALLKERFTCPLCGSEDVRFGSETGGRNVRTCQSCRITTYHIPGKGNVDSDGNPISFEEKKAKRIHKHCGKEMAVDTVTISHTAYVCLKCGKRLQTKGGWGSPEVLADGFSLPVAFVPVVE